MRDTLITMMAVILVACSSTPETQPQPVPEAPRGEAPAETESAGPLAGTASFELTYTADDRLRPGDAEAIAERVRGLGAGARVVSADERRVVLRVENASSSQEVVTALRPRRVAFHLVERAPEVELPEGVSRDEGGSLRGACAAIEALRQERPCRSAIEVLPAEAGCVAHCLAAAPALRAEDIAEAGMGADPSDDRPVVLLTLESEAVDRFAALTAAHVGERLALVVDERIESAPVIRAAMGQRVQFTFDRASPQEELLEAAALVSSIRSGALPSGAASAAPDR